ncbi:MAG: HK97 gp10 family phage protein [Candidatus Nitrosocaldus sp.]|nr:HK97 gp10 family phage protein [Candidatus Nitrosocaldus sp.]MCS7141550.1 HK97 gp10 family phage protein [Candidatus Nitrosocaldus sp.]MDW8000330.1 HK97 gp10 family phage protein [Candidatus Nitrosocaldus sp.]MDW8275166.1 HK97 gp10 family phage protein [Candidatus Nitrosocaldus sp.]
MVVEIRLDMDSGVKDAMAQRILEEIRSRTPVKTGALRSSLRYEIKGGEIDFYALQYFHYIDKGTRRHFVRPVGARALRWIDEVTGEDRFSRGLWVSGITPSNILDLFRLTRIAKDELISRIGDIVKVNRT